MVPGVEVWVQAQQQLGVQTDIPAAAVTICCGCNWDFVDFSARETSDATLAGLLQLAMKSRRPAVAATAAAALQRLPALLEPGTVRLLLVTAAMRQHSEALQHLAALAAVQQHVDAATLQTVLIELVTHADNSSYVQLLRRFPAAAAQLKRSTVAELLQAAVERGRCVWVQQLCKLPGAQRLSSNVTAQLLQTAVDRGYCECTYYLCSLSAARRLGNEAVAELLEAAVKCPEDVTQWAVSDCIHHLCRLPAAQQLSSEVLASLLHAAVQRNSGAGADWLCKLPAAQQLSSSCVTELLCAAAKQRNQVVMQGVCRLPAAVNLKVSEDFGARLQHVASTAAAVLATVCSPTGVSLSPL
uniref:Uncharacterized protein n=1 Tax=Tetradesmus obliquus TaxID=3088 RepID=A0A383WDR5_TETOB|eukprot:jgi/Sobl393_1/3818/SZX75259.1